MRYFFLLIALISTTITSVTAQNHKHSRVKIWTGDAGLKKLSSLGIETDHGDIRKNVWFISDFSEMEIAKIANAGFRYDIQIEDIVSYYRNQTAQTISSQRSLTAANCNSTIPQYPIPANFSLGSMGGYFTYQEMFDNLDSMASLYPSLITIKQALPGGNTIENRPVYYVKISDNAAIDESEPEVLYSAVHHAREPGGMSQLIYYMWYLLENYNTNPELASIVDNTELFFITCLNPDGYEFNYLNEPLGGGLWRKNRRDNLDGTFGVDLNRNYGFNWGFDDDGSSPFTGDETYRGTVPFSEPETQLMSAFVNSRDFKIALNYHTFGNLLIYPWGYNYSIYTPDSALYTNYGSLLTTYNGYTYGTADQTVGYIVNGSSDDWMYGEQIAKPKVFAMTPECGDAAFGFWPPINEIIPLCQSNMFQNITMAQLAGKYATVTETSPELISAGVGTIQFTLKQLGLDTTGTYTISLTAITPNIILTGNSVVHGI
ncbi:MAG: zinc carboxypeptidase [Bacteroidetes bacterium]|nr:zinc carboxypeptidase [Bacteroidota bacterium]